MMYVSLIHKSNLFIYFSQKFPYLVKKSRQEIYEAQQQTAKSSQQNEAKPNGKAHIGTDVPKQQQQKPTVSKKELTYDAEETVNLDDPIVSNLADINQLISQEIDATDNQIFEQCLQIMASNIKPPPSLSHSKPDALSTGKKKTI